MSLLKARNTKSIRASYESLQKDFLTLLDTNDTKYDRADLVALIGVYTDISVKYLQSIAYSLTEPKSIQDSMKFMNSYIVEIVFNLNLKFIHAEEGYSIIDKCIQEALTKGNVVPGFIEGVIDDIQESYEEPEVAETVEV